MTTDAAWIDIPNDTNVVIDVNHDNFEKATQFSLKDKEIKKAKCKCKV